MSTKKRVSSIASSYSTVTAPPIDLSMRELREFSEMKLEENQNADQLKKLIEKHGKENVIVNSVRLNNNKISAWPNFISFLKPMVEITQIQWLDLSFNQLPTIEGVICRLTSLRKLHLHANQITDITDVEKLQDLKYLKDLTLHGNPIENRGRQKYRNFIIGCLPQLNSLDFTSLTSRDKAIAESFCRNPVLKRSCLIDEEKNKKKE